VKDEAPRIEREFVIGNELGLHARPAGRFATLAGRFSSEISLSRGEEWVNGSSVLSILSLAAGLGVVVRLRAEGTDAEAAISELGALLESTESG
jgi:phosphotransferase system HPr (HPr) family protein